MICLNSGKIMKRFIIYTNPYKDVDGSVTEKVKKLLEAKGAEVVSAASDTSDAITLVLGGDGTMLQAIRENSSAGPFIGINLGNLGFLTDIDLENVEDAIDKLIAEDYWLEKRMLLEGVVRSDETTKPIWALNDVVLTRCDGLHILRFDILVNGQALHEYLADGMIVCTPTGSTGYNLSAGGPLASPGSELIMLTPICPHSLNQRSIILSSDDVVEFYIPESKDGHKQMMEVSFDGNSKLKVTTGDRIEIRKSEHFVNFVKIGRDSFLEVLNRKMSEK